ncbi:LacI family DNA-binding transcriptional regulator [Hymenobacter edaphi]|uniref:LacI family DNA-binding transcriptional regulator n=1 Tax=Hymenobacter edaphi TaxID=2211146 RepID=UPI0014039B78|nr:LacI family DNA-binding transcriptional regulator [Hymenobacter edaphi]
MARNTASISDLAKALDLSVSTISRALSDHPGISDATKKRVWQLARSLNYQPNHLASALRKGRSNLLGVIVPHIDGHFFMTVVKGIEALATKAGFSILICQSNEDVRHERQNLETLLNAQVAGILVSLARTTQDDKHFDKVRKRGIPLVFFDRVPDSPAVSAVVIDDYQGAYQATQHLLDQGCGRIAHFAGPQHLNIYRHRRQGYLDALRHAGRPADESLVLYSDLCVEDGRAGVRQLLRQQPAPDAIFSASDFALVGALKELKAQGLAVPQDMALVGFSNESFTSFTDPLLSSVDQGSEQLGQSAVRLLLEMLEDEPARFAPRRTVLQPTLLVRESSLRRPPQA